MKKLNKWRKIIFDCEIREMILCREILQEIRTRRTI